ncbi:16S rRNA (cytidine(1402)-2'-O)-methyltransferase [Candidatus Woesearchaeota archaeon]|nr:16S rRNA (cytidine(1402)-2'-O)-methyltransferase [Candidatus Woesearchaeota archaeon]
MVSTPIGNLSDITYRALDTLREADIMAVEDTRRTRKLMQHYGIDNRLVAFHDMNKEKAAPGLLEMLRQGKDIALVSDSGTPGISDPAFYLVRECITLGIQIIPVPGPSSLVSALVCSGLPTDRFMFLGFLPKKPGKLEKEIMALKGSGMTTVAFESPHRIKKTLAVMKKHIPDFNIVIARELTKKFEEFVRGRLADIADQERDYKGEIVLILSRK